MGAVSEDVGIRVGMERVAGQVVTVLELRGVALAVLSVELEVLASEIVMILA